MNTVPYHLCFDTLANELRIRILKELDAGPKSVQTLSETLDEEQSKISHSLKVLRDCSYVSVKQDGKRRIYSLVKGKNVPKKIPKTNDGAGMIGFVDGHASALCEECKKIGKGVLQ